MCGAEVMTIALVPILTRAHGNELRQVLVERTESVMNPGAEVWEISVVLVASGVKLRLSSMIAVCGPEGSNEGQFVSVLGDMREPIADFHTALAMLLEADLERIKCVALIAIGVGNDKPFEGEFFGILDAGKRCFGDGLPRVLRQHRFWVETFHVTDAAIHEQPNDIFGFGREMRATGGRGP